MIILRIRSTQQVLRFLSTADSESHPANVQDYSKKTWPTNHGGQVLTFLPQISNKQFPILYVSDTIKVKVDKKKRFLSWFFVN